MVAALLALGVIGCTPAALRIAVLYSPGCIHCTEVIRADIEPLRARYGERIDITLYDIGKGEGKRLYRQAEKRTGKPFEELGVPVVVIDGEILYGDAIHEQVDDLVWVKLSE